MERPLFWHQGLFLQPQHFQLQDRYIQSLTVPLQSFLQPHFWGIGSLKIQDAALENLSLQILEGKFQFPGGSYVSLPENGLIDSRSFNEDWIESSKPLEILLGLRKWNPSGQNVTVVSSLESVSNVTTRFVTSKEPDEVQDLYQGGPGADIKRLYYVLKVFWNSEKEKLGDYELIPLARLQRQGEHIVRSERFFPPCLHINAVEPLKELITEIRDQLAARTHMLETYKRERGIHTAEFGTRDTVFFLALRSLNRYVPLLFHFTESPSVHPWTVYGTLRQIIGELSSFSETVNVLGEQEGGSSLVPPYNHRKLHTCFLAVRDILLRLLDEITAGPEYIMELAYDGTYYSAEMSPAMFVAHNRFYLVLTTDEVSDQVLNNFSGLAKTGSRESLPLLITQALAGIKVSHLDNPPQELPQRVGSLYFQLDHHGELWERVQSSNNLAVFWDNAPQDIKVELMIVSRRS